MANAMPGSLAWPAAAMLLAATLAVGGAAQAAPSTFGTVVGGALLCLDEVDNKYFYDYLNTAFGRPYKHEGGAYWFKANGNLWDTSITDVIVSDDTSALKFVGAVADATPEKVEQSILTAAGIHYTRKDASKFPVRESTQGSTIVYFQKKSKVFCAKYKPLPPPSR